MMNDKTAERWSNAKCPERDDALGDADGMVNPTVSESSGGGSDGCSAATGSALRLATTEDPRMLASKSVTGAFVKPPKLFDIACCVDFNS